MRTFPLSKSRQGLSIVWTVNHFYRNLMNHNSELCCSHTNTLTQTRTHTQSHLYSTSQTECPHKVVFCLLIKEVAGLRKIPTSVSLFTNSRGTEVLSHRSNRVSDDSLKGFDMLCRQQWFFFIRFFFSSTLSFLYAKDSHHWYASHPIISKKKNLNHSYNKPTCADCWCVTSRRVFLLLSPASAVLVL